MGLGCVCACQARSVARLGLWLKATMDGGRMEFGVAAWRLAPPWKNLGDVVRLAFPNLPTPHWGRIDQDNANWIKYVFEIAAVPLRFDLGGHMYYGELTAPFNPPPRVVRGGDLDPFADPAEFDAQLAEFRRWHRI